LSQDVDPRLGILVEFVDRIAKLEVGPVAVQLDHRRRRVGQRCRSNRYVRAGDDLITHSDGVQRLLHQSIKVGRDDDLYPAAFHHLGDGVVADGRYL
jgi:hypothetical protein